MRVTPAQLVRWGTAALSDAWGKMGAMQHDMQCRSASAERVPEAFEITAHKGKYQAINPAQVVTCE